MIFGRGLQPDEPEGIEAIALALGISDPEEAMSGQKVKDRLRRNTEEAIAADVFGVPTFVVNSQVFWGGDAAPMMLDYLGNPGLFETPEMKRISEMPMGLSRRR